MRAKFNLDHPSEAIEPAQKTVQSLYKKTLKAPLKLPKLPENTMKIGLGILGCIVVIGIGIQIRSRIQKPSPVAKPSTVQTPTPLSKEAVRDIVEKVRKHMVLPEETPQVVAITNVDSLKKQQVFFATANNGDQLLVYPSKVILYRPGTDQVVDVAQIRASASSSSLLR